MDYPDVRGYTLAKAKELLRQKGFFIGDIKVLTPPREASEGYDNDYRVVKIAPLGSSGLELLVCRPL